MLVHLRPPGALPESSMRWSSPAPPAIASLSSETSSPRRWLHSSSNSQQFFPRTAGALLWIRPRWRRRCVYREMASPRAELRDKTSPAIADDTWRRNLADLQDNGVTRESMPAERLSSAAYICHAC
eukprot:6951502-Pyramimonas_sp.AAC.3